MRPLMRNAWLALGLLLVLGPTCVVSGDQAPALDQMLQYEADAPKTILELQPFRRATSQTLTDASGRRGTATLVELNPGINAWFLLRLDWESPAETHLYHLENPRPRQAWLRLSPDTGQGLRITAKAGDANCILWPDHAAVPLEEARRSGLPYAPLCEGRLYLRNPVAGSYTRLEQVTNFLRDHVWGGDRIVNFVKEEFFRDAFAETGTELTPGPGSVTGARLAPADAPLGPGLQGTAVGTSVAPEHLALDVRGVGNGLGIGNWYPVNDAHGVYVSAIRPESIAAAIVGGSGGRVPALDAVEGGALDYLVAFDLAEFELGFALGTDHPRVDWSGREPAAMHDERLAGPDGIGVSTPLARTGMVSPALTALTVATFAGGFKREHGAFRYGELARQNHGSHYGFIEQGAVFSKLQPGLATVYVLEDGTVGMKTWSKDDDGLLSRVRFARQNGVPLLERAVGAGGAGVVGPLVSQWGMGNWSGSADEKLRTLRAGLCLQSTGTHRFLIYGYFSTATPSAMARVFQAYRCEYAMHLDMNALEHTYLALYTRRGGQLLVQHLIEGMSEVDRKGGDQLAPRFLGFPDDRDFFYLVRRAASPDLRETAH
jgi:hypothetical protein